MSAARSGLERLQTALGEGISSAGREVRENARVRLGLAGLAFALILGLALRVYTHATSRQTEIVQMTETARNLEHLNGPAGETWLEARAEAERLLSASERRLWSQADIGVAHADFYNWIATTAEEAGLLGANVRIADARRTSSNDSLVDLRVTISVSTATGGSLNPEAIYGFLREVSRSPRLIVVRSLRVRFEPVVILEGEFSAFVDRPPENRTTGASETPTPQR